MNPFKLAALGLAAALAASSASAALSVADLSTSGDGLLTVDSVSGLGWLDVSLTRGQSLDQVVAGSWLAQGFRLATSAEFDALLRQGVQTPDLVDWLGGWAAAPEISAYAGGPTTILSGVVGGDGPRTDGLVPMRTLALTRDTQIGGEPVPAPEWISRAPWTDGVGVLGPAVSAGELKVPLSLGAGTQGDPETEITELLKKLAPSAQPPGDPRTFLRHRTEWVSPHEANEEWGVFLVKSVSAVPEPDAFLLMGVGLVGVLALRPRRKTA